MLGRLNIRHKLALVLWGSALLALALAGTGAALYQSLTLERRAHQLMEPYVQLIVVGTDAAVAFQDPVRAQEILDTLRANPNILEAEIVLENGRVLARYSRSGDTRAVPPSARRETISFGVDSVKWSESLPNGARLHFNLSLAQIREQMQQTVWLFGAGGLVLIAVTLGLLAALQRVIIRPVTTLARAAELARSQADYSSRVPAAGTDEVAQLGKSFNAMMTAVREREDDLRKLSLFQRTLLDNAAYAIISSAPDGIITSHNRAAERLTGFSAAEVVGKATPLLWHDPEEVAQRARELSADLGETITPGFEVFTARARRNMIDENEWSLVRKNGTRVPVLLSVTAIRDGTGLATGFVGLVNDLSERKKLETQLRQAQKMEAVGQLAGGVAHDFNNMLGVIIGHAELALYQMDPALPLFNSLQEIQKAADRSANLTRQLLMFASKQTIDPILIDINETVEGIFNMLRRLIGEDIELTWLPGANAWPVKMDPSQIDQVLANLCVNARDAIAGVGKVTIETQNVVFKDDYCADHPDFAPGDYVLLAVSDDGCGMDHETLGRVFEPFFTTKETGRGTGLGLATVYGIVKQNRGFVSVYSQPGHGSTFKVYLPRHAAAIAPEAIESPLAPVKRGDETILLVEDEASMLEMTTLMLEGCGYRVVAASTPREAIRAARAYKGEIHLLVTDVIMPEMNGRDLERLLVTLRPELKCLFMSGYTGSVIAHEGTLAGQVHFIHKPFSRRALATKAREVLDGSD